MERFFCFTSVSTLKWLENAKKSEKNSSKSFPFFELKLYFSHEVMQFLKTVLWHFLTGIMWTPLIVILKIRLISRIIAFFWFIIIYLIKRPKKKDINQYIQYKIKLQVIIFLCSLFYMDLFTKIQLLTRVNYLITI